MTKLGCTFLVSAALIAGWPFFAHARDVHVAVLAVHGSERAAKDFEPTLEHLNRGLPEHRFIMTPLDPAGIAQAVQGETVDFVITNPGYYVELESKHGLTRLATLESHEHNPPTDAVGSTVVAPNRPGAPHSFNDLSGLRLAIVADDAFGGWRVIWREMQDAGVPPERLASRVETGFPMQRVINAMREGHADAGVLRACQLEEEIASGSVSPTEFVVVAERTTPGFPCRLSSRLYPDWPFSRLAHTPTSLAKAVAANLLIMTPVDGRAWTAPQDYTPVHALFRELKIRPYEYLAHTTVQSIVRSYWQWLVLVCLAVAWWVFHVFRVEILVRRRTAELTHAIEGREAAERAAQLHREQRDQFSRLGILGEMASNIAHELNQPLAAITNYAEGITRFVDSGHTDPAFIRDGARGIAGQAERAGVIIRRIRGFVKRREVSREPLDVNHLVRETLDLFQGTAALRKIALHVVLGTDLPKVTADLLELEQVLLNLLQNALDAMDTKEGMARRQLGIEVSTNLIEHNVVVAVRDHGSGLTDEVRAHLFDTFFTTKPQGLGLGLSICRTIVESHGGRLWAVNEPDGGLTMRFSLPIAEMETF